MAKVITGLTICCLIFICVFGEPIPEENASTDMYEQRIKLLTGTTTPPTCNEKKNVGECLKQIFQDIQPRIAPGIPELNIQPVDPLQLNSTVFNFELGVISGRLQMKNAVIHGLSSNQLKKVDLKVKDGLITYEMKTFVPKMRLTGNYKAAIKFNKQFDLKPHGTFNLTLYNVTINFNTEGKFYEKDGHKFERLHKIDAEPKIGNMDMDITGLFEDPELNEFALTIAKQYWRDTYKEVLSQTRDYWAPMVMRMINEALSIFPYDSFIKNE